MSESEVMSLQAIKDAEARVSLLLAIHCAPVLSGIKAANIITVTKQEFSQIRNLLQGTNISYYFFRMRNYKGILYLYRKSEIVKYLNEEENQIFLKEFGYVPNHFDQLLEHLSDRIEAYSGGKGGFPHEIGIFLEYPLMDVKSFLRNKGENFLYMGYWKVYHNLQDTLNIFGEYDKEKHRVVRAIISGERIRNLVK